MNLKEAPIQLLAITSLAQRMIPSGPLPSMGRVREG